MAQYDIYTKKYLSLDEIKKLLDEALVKKDNAKINHYSYLLMRESARVRR